MEWKPGMKVRCIKAYDLGIPRKVGDILTLTKVDCFGNWDYEEGRGCVGFSNKKYWEVVDMEFTKDYLKVGMLVELGDGRKYIVMDEKRAVRNEGIINLCHYRNNLTFSQHSRCDYNIVKVYSAKYDYGFDWTCKYRVLLWERKEETIKEITMEELEKDYGCKVKIVKE